jgi:hypothetical protein
VEENMQQRGQSSDLVLSNGATVNFKVRKDGSGRPVISALQIQFPTSTEVPEGGITAALLREIRMTDLLGAWFEESRVSFLDDSSERFLWARLSQDWRPNGRNPISSNLYAALAYFYVQSCKQSIAAPTLDLSEKLGVNVRTISTRLSQARKLGLLTQNRTSSPSGKAGGELTPLGKRILQEIVKER